MTEIVTATVVEVPKPERPDCYIPLYQYKDTGDIDCFGPQETPEKAFAMLADSGKLNGVVVKVPGSASPQAENAIAELCWMGHEPRFGKANALGKFWCRIEFDDKPSMFKYGPDPQSAARACLEAIRKAGG